MNELCVLFLIFKEIVNIESSSMLVIHQAGGCRRFVTGNRSSYVWGKLQLQPQLFPDCLPHWTLPWQTLCICSQSVEERTLVRKRSEVCLCEDADKCLAILVKMWIKCKHLLMQKNHLKLILFFLEKFTL